jgi:hypothetical protein
VIADDLDPVGVSAAPRETYPPLIVDPDAVLTGAITAEPLETVPRWYPQILWVHRRIQHPELPKSDLLHLGAESFRRSTIEQPLGIAITEALDHAK